MDTKTCSVCGVDCTPKPDSCGTGYARTADNAVVCYSCATWQELRDMRDTGKGVLYLTIERENNSPCGIPSGRVLGHKGHLSNWPGVFTLHVNARKGRHNMAGTRYDVWFTAFGREWHGVQYGENTQLCHCRASRVTKA